MGDTSPILCLNLFKPVREIYDGIRTGTIPWIPCLTVTVVFEVCLFFQFDFWLISKTNFIWLYPEAKALYYFYYFTLVTSSFWVWAFLQVGVKRRLTQRLTEMFQSCGLRNNLGKLPNLVFDRPLDAATRKLRLTRAVLPLKAFNDARESLNSGLQIFIDEIRENRVEGTVDVIYSHYPMPNIFKIEDIVSIGRNRFLVGITRSKKVYSDLDLTPHLLVAGQTGKGKSTFLRQFITSLFLNDKTARFTLVDLKGGLEFQLFEKLPRIEIPESTKMAVFAIQKILETLDERMRLLKANRCKDIVEFQNLEADKRVDAEGVSKNISLNRHIIVVDEAAEMFLAGHHASAQEIQTAKRVLSKVARQGRSLGVHLVVATQRPDSKALDPQVKANLAGVICFQMANDASSITVLGNGRATDLPPTPGRAIWKCGADMVEVQTPLLETSEVEELFKDEHKESPKKPVVQSETKSSNSDDKCPRSHAVED